LNQTGARGHSIAHVISTSALIWSIPASIGTADARRRRTGMSATPDAIAKLGAQGVHDLLDLAELDLGGLRQALGLTDGVLDGFLARLVGCFLGIGNAELTPLMFVAP
jgi:hypothetical protein